MRILKKLFCITLALLMPILLTTGCLHSAELNERALVQAMGIDRKNGMYQITLQVFDPQGGGTTTAVDASKVNSQVILVEGQTISEAFLNASLQKGKEVFYGHNKLVIIGESAAREGISAITNFLNSNPDFRPNVDMAVCQGDASEIVSAQISQGLLPALEIQMTLANEEKNGQIFRGRFYQVMQSLSSPDRDPCMPFVELYQDKLGNSTVRVSGTALFHDEFLVGQLNREETKGLLFAANKMKKTLVNVQDDSLGLVSLEVIRSSTGIKGSFQWEEAPEFTLQIRLKSRAQEVNGTKLSSVNASNVKQIEEEQDGQIAKTIENALEKTLVFYGVDPIGLERYCPAKVRRQIQENREQWLQLRAQSQFHVTVTSEIESFGLQKDGDSKGGQS